MAYTNDFDEYKRLGEPEKAEKAEIWQTAIGLQQVDGLTPSDYLFETAKRNIEGEITIYEVHTRLNSYYEMKPLKATEERIEEADKVSARIAEILSERTFSFSPAEYITIHKRLFTGIYEFAGKIRDYNISKAEWVLGGETVFYASADSIRATLDYDFAQEKAFVYKGLGKEVITEHIARFISGIWQIHAFGEGNTRTTAVFAIKYLRTFGFAITNDLFARHSWYFRNALVRANYSDYKNNVFATQDYLNRFFENLLLGENNALKNRDMRIAMAGDEDIGTANGTVAMKDGTLNGTVFSLIQSNPKITGVQLARQLGVGLRTVRREMKRLKDEGWIERVGSDKAGYWVVTKNEDS